MLPVSIVSLHGMPGSLKSTMACSWPGQKGYYDFEFGYQRVWKAQDMLESKEVLLRSYKIPNKVAQRRTQLQGFRETYEEFVAQYSADCTSVGVKSIILDTNTALWQLVPDGYLQQLQEEGKPRKQLIQIEYREPNSRMNMILSLPRSYGKNLILIHHDAPERKPMVDQMGKPITDENGQQATYQTGKMVMDGYKYTEGLSDWVFRCQFSAGTLQVLVEKSGLHIGLVGLQLEWKMPAEEAKLYDKIVQYLNALGVKV